MNKRKKKLEMDIAQLIMEFEKEFGISIPDEDTAQINTVQDVVAYIEKLLPINP